MPPTIEVSHKANYAEAEIGLLVASALAAGRALSSEGMGLSISNAMIIDSFWLTPSLVLNPV